MPYKQKNSPFKQTATKAALGATSKKSGSSYDKFIDNTASYLKGEQGLIPDSITGGKPTRQAIGDGIRKVANSIDPRKKLKKSTKKATAVSNRPTQPKRSTPTGKQEIGFTKQEIKPSKPTSKEELNLGYSKSKKKIKAKSIPSNSLPAKSIKQSMQLHGQLPMMKRIKSASARR